MALLPARTCIVLLAGLPGTGKSTLAKALVARLPFTVILNKDDIRAAMFPIAVADYSEAQNALAMTALLSAVGYLCERDHRPDFLLIDGRTFSRAEHIEQVIHFAQEHDASWSILHLWCPDLIAYDRLDSAQAGHPARNRNRNLYTSLQSSFEPIVWPHLTLDTSLPLEETVQTTLDYLGA